MPTLDDAAALLIQLDPAVDAGYEEFHHVLLQIVASGNYSAGVKTALVDAMLHVDDIRSVAVDERAQRLESIQHLLERAMTAHERGDDGTPVTPTVDGFAASRVTAFPGQPAGALVIPADADRSLLREFVAESREALQSSETAMLRLESEPHDRDALESIFRAFHTVKGTSAFLGLDLISSLAHQDESLLAEIRSGTGRAMAEVAEFIFLSIDVLLDALSAIESAEPGANVPLSEDFANVLDALGVAPAVDRASLPADRDALHAPPPPGGSNRVHEGRDSNADALVRVATTRLDQLVELTGELAIATSAIRAELGNPDASVPSITQRISRAEKLARGVQELGLSMRMVPLTGVFQRAARIVRDLARRSGKPVELVARGERIEIDRKIAEAISDPLVHMLRNAIDHGIEAPDERARVGKPPVGTIMLTASQAAGGIIVELRDDGRGLDRERILQRALERGMTDAAQSRADGEIERLIFLPGFSTATTVTDLSGRGVGMDVARRRIEEVRGHLDLSSIPGKGTCFTIRLPLTLALTNTMMIRAGSERYLVPTDAIRVTLRPERAQLRTIGGRNDVLVLRDEVIPVLRLHDVLSISGAVTDPCAALLMVVQSGRQAAAILIDELLGQHQVVARSVGAGAPPASGVSGAAILDDGRIGLVLDVNALLALDRPDEAARPPRAVA